ncbi:DedA family protein [Alicyclobacillus sp. SO9]|uniref:DedA family protein n=1 Tax=Alicyclobacillus sp. SO9 TaxID=2665646 RepID=UPI0018E81FA6|nr:DedA family protein [Alicyclobacillus sp. SO9]QQE81321.1 DedA family protein [Alicyclobacillus sp. SO9]
MHFDVQHFIHTYGYVGVFFILLTEMIGIPFPAETTLTISGFEWTQHVFSLVPLVVAAVIGNVVGSTVAYGIGRYLGRPVILALGRYVGITEERLNAAERRFQRSELWIVLFAKFIAGIRVLVPYLAGINKMRFYVFSIINAISAVLWVLFFVLIGKYIGIAWRRYHFFFHRFAIPIVILIVVMGLGYVIWRWIRKTRG